MRIWRTQGRTEEIGFDDVGRGTVLVLLHAFPFDRSMFAAQLEAFQATHRVLVPDLGSFGNSHATGDWTIEKQADLLALWLDSVAPMERIILGGLSMGGYIALAFARLHSQKVRKLILMDTQAPGDSDEARANRENSIEKVKTDGVAAFVEGMIPKLLGKTTQATRPDVVKHVRELASRQQPEAVISALQALRDRPDATPTLAKMDMPTLVIVGQEDVVTPLEAARVLTQGIPQAQMVELEGVGHLANLEDASLFNKKLAEFLKVE